MGRITDKHQASPSPGWHGLHIVEHPNFDVCVGERGDLSRCLAHVFEASHELVAASGLVET
jgi:hypothetical protein